MHICKFPHALCLVFCCYCDCSAATKEFQGEGGKNKKILLWQEKEMIHLFTPSSSKDLCREGTPQNLSSVIALPGARWQPLKAAPGSIWNVMIPKLLSCVFSCGLIKNVRNQFLQKSCRKPKTVLCVRCVVRFRIFPMTLILWQLAAGRKSKGHLHHISLCSWEFQSWLL